MFGVRKDFVLSLFSLCIVFWCLDILQASFGNICTVALHFRLASLEQMFCFHFKSAYCPMIDESVKYEQ